MHTLDTNNHSVFLLNYHLVFLIKYRRKVIDDSISSRLSDIFLYIGKIHGIELQNGIMMKIMYVFYLKVFQTQIFQNS